MTINNNIKLAYDNKPASALSHFYTEEELTWTKHGTNAIESCSRYDQQVTAEEVRRNISALCHDILDPIADTYGKMPMGSVYRNPLVNKLAGGSPDSAHMVGLAGDGQPVQAAAVVAFCYRNWKQFNLDRIIYEERQDKWGKVSKWLHFQRLRLGTPGHEVKDAKLFSSPPIGTDGRAHYDPYSIEQLMSILLTASKKVTV